MMMKSPKTTFKLHKNTFTKNPAAPHDLRRKCQIRTQCGGHMPEKPGALPFDSWRESLSLSPSRPWQPRQWPRISRHPCRSPPDCRTRTPEEIRNKCELLFAITPLLQLRKQIWMKIKHRNSSIVFIERIRVKIRIRVLIRSGYGSGFDEFHWKFNYTGNRKKILSKNIFKSKK